MKTFKFKLQILQSGGVFVTDETTVRLPYDMLGTLLDEPALTVCAGRRPGEEELLVLNRIPHSAETRDLFRDLYFYSTHRPERSDFVELYSADRDFYAVFRYHQSPSLAALYGSCPGPTARRLSVLVAALFRVTAGETAH
mgnify:FL=1